MRASATASAACCTRFVDREWTEPLPIYAFAIEHPEGVIIVDTGETAGASQPGYFPRWHPVFRSRCASGSSPNRRSGRSSSSSAFDQTMSAELVMTHLHTDHAGGLHHFPGTEILVAPAELDLRERTPGTACAAIPNNRWPAWFDPTPLSLESEPYGPFPQSLRLTRAGDITVVPLPGHSPGHVGVLVEDGDHSIFFAGDSSYTQDLLLRGTVDGVGTGRALRTRSPTNESAPTSPLHPTVYLVAHDPDTGWSARRAPTHSTSRRWRSPRDHFPDQHRYRTPDRGGVRVRLRSAQLPLVELGCPSRTPDIRSSGQHRLDLRDETAATEGSSHQPTRDRRA